MKRLKILTFFMIGHFTELLGAILLQRSLFWQFLPSSPSPPYAPVRSVALTPPHPPPPQGTFYVPRPGPLPKDRSRSFCATDPPTHSPPRNVVCEWPLKEGVTKIVSRDNFNFFHRSWANFAPQKKHNLTSLQPPPWQTCSRIIVFLLTTLLVEAFRCCEFSGTINFD